jgi:hypothetical protein
MHPIPITLRPLYPVHRIACRSFLCIKSFAQRLLNRIAYPASCAKNPDTVLCIAAASLTFSDQMLPDLVSPASPTRVASDKSNGSAVAKTRFLMRYIFKTRKKTA